MSVRPAGKVRYDNEGRVILVSGGGQGIGLAVCTAFHASGASVLCFDIDAAAAVTLPAELELEPSAGMQPDASAGSRALDAGGHERQRLQAGRGNLVAARNARPVMARIDLVDSQANLFDFTHA